MSLAGHTPSVRFRQCEYAIWWREPETKIFPTLQELGIGFVPYCPLGRAFLTGVINENSRFQKGDRRWNLPQFQPEALKHNMPLVHLVQEWAKRKGVTPAQFALMGHRADPFTESQIDK